MYRTINVRFFPSSCVSSSRVDRCCAPTASIKHRQGRGSHDDYNIGDRLTISVPYPMFFSLLSLSLLLLLYCTHVIPLLAHWHKFVADSLTHTYTRKMSAQPACHPAKLDALLYLPSWHTLRNGHRKRPSPNLISPTVLDANVWYFLFDLTPW